MRNDTLLAVLLGALVASASIAGNVWRGDTHLVSAYPGVVTALLVPVAVYSLVRRRARTGAGRTVLRHFGLRLGVISGAVFGLGLALFTALWLTSAWSLLVALVAASAFALTVAESWMTAAVAARLHAAR